MKKQFAIYLVACGLWAATAPLPLQAQDPTRARDTVRVEQDDEGFDLGWLGLIGLAGLAGLTGRRNRVDDHTVRSTANR